MTSTIDPSCRIALGDRQRDALRAGAETNDDELTGLAYGGNAGRLTTSLCTSADSVVVGEHLVTT